MRSYQEQIQKLELEHRSVLQSLQSLQRSFLGNDVEWSQQSILQRRLRRIEEAQQRVGAGGYGQCQMCGRMINPERLLALPEATTCMDCNQNGNKRYAIPITYQEEAHYGVRHCPNC